MLALTFAVLLFVGWRVAVVSVPANLPEEAVASVPHSPAVSENAINSAIKKTDSRPENRSHEFDVPTTSPLSQSAAEDVEITGLFREAGVAYLSLAGEAADVVRDAAALVSVPPSPGNSVVRASDNGDGNSAPEPEGPLSPWGRRFGAAVDFLFETDPADDTPSI